MSWIPGTGWETLLKFDFGKASGAASTPNKRKSPAAVGVPITRGRSDPGSAGTVGGESKLAAAVAALPNLASPRKVAHSGSDLTWRTILSSVVEVDGVGELGVARVLQEVWKRGGGDAVSVWWRCCNEAHDNR